MFEHLFILAIANHVIPTVELALLNNAIFNDFEEGCLRCADDDTDGALFLGQRAHD